jgi:hypothetical protein
MGGWRVRAGRGGERGRTGQPTPPGRGRGQIR